MASEHVVAVTDDNFEQEVLASIQPVILDFWAPWCAPCRSLGPILEDVAVQYAGRVKVAKMNVDENGRVPAEFSVASIPTIVFFKEGKVLETIVGLTSKDGLVKAIDKLFPPA